MAVGITVEHIRNADDDDIGSPKVCYQTLIIATIWPIREFIDSVMLSSADCLSQLVKHLEYVKD